LQQNILHSIPPRSFHEEIIESNHKSSSSLQQRMAAESVGDSLPSSAFNQSSIQIESWNKDHYCKAT
jgi:hypothetical protein